MNTLHINNLYVVESSPENYTEFYYLINGVYYYAHTLYRTEEELLNSGLVSEFTIDPNGSLILVLETKSSFSYYQQSSSGEFVGLRRVVNFDNNDHYENEHILQVPLPGGQEINGVFQSLPLSDIDEDALERFRQYFRPLNNDSNNQILDALNGRSIQEENIDEKSLEQLSYETYIKQISGLPIILPEYLIINGLRVNFIPFEIVKNIQIDRYIIDPVLQPWADATCVTSNKIITLFGKNGMTYLVKARYDPVTNQIFLPYIE